MTASAANAVTCDGGVLYLAIYDPETVDSIKPTSASSPLNAAFKDLGYWAEDGSEITPVPGDTVTITAHNGDIVIEKTKKGNLTLKFPFIELNKEVHESYWDTTVAADGSYEIADGRNTREFCLVYDRLFSDETVDRQFSPRVRISDRAAVTNSDSDPVTHEMTFGTLKADGFASHIYGWSQRLATGS
jgi:hypothetical protein